MGGVVLTRFRHVKPLSWTIYLWKYIPYADLQKMLNILVKFHLNPGSGSEGILLIHCLIQLIKKCVNSIFCCNRNSLILGQLTCKAVAIISFLNLHTCNWLNSANQIN